MKLDPRDRAAGQAPAATDKHCDDQVKVVTSPMAAEQQSEACSVELDPHYQQDQVHEDLHPAVTGLLLVVALVMGIAPALVQLGFLLL